METRINTSIKTTRIAVIVGCVVLVIAIGIFALIAFTGGGETLSREEILLNMKELEREDPGYELVASYLSAYGIGNFDRAKFKTVEQYFILTFYKPLPKASEMARDTANAFLEQYYDSLDLADTKATTDALLRCYVEATGDIYSFYRTKEEYAEFEEDLSGESTSVGIGVMIQANYQDVTLEIMSVLPHTPAEEAGLKSGDFIVAVDDIKLSEVGIDAIMEAMRGEVGSTVRVTVKRGGEEITVSATRQTLNEHSVFLNIDSNKIATVQITEFNAKTFEEFKEAVDSAVAQNAKGIIFDMRNNPGGYLDAVIKAIDYVAPDGQIICTYTVGQSETTTYKSEDGHYVDLPMVVLCNYGTASAGELFTAALRDYAKAKTMSVRIVGENTYGKGIMQGSVPLYDGSVITYTMAYYNPPSGVNYDGVGIKPDVELPYGEDDAQMKEAINQLSKLIYGPSGVPTPDL